MKKKINIHKAIETIEEDIVLDICIADGDIVGLINGSKHYCIWDSYGKSKTSSIPDIKERYREDFIMLEYSERSIFKYKFVVCKDYGYGKNLNGPREIKSFKKREEALKFLEEKNNEGTTKCKASSIIK